MSPYISPFLTTCLSVVNLPFCPQTSKTNEHYYIYETKACHYCCLVTVIVEEDQINTLVSSPRAFIHHQYQQKNTKITKAW